MGQKEPNGECQIELIEYTSQPHACDLCDCFLSAHIHMGIIVAYRKFITKSIGSQLRMRKARSGMGRKPINSLKSEHELMPTFSARMVDVRNSPSFSRYIWCDIHVFASAATSLLWAVFTLFESNWIFHFPFHLSCCWERMTFLGCIRVNSTKFYDPYNAIDDFWITKES